MRFPLDPELLAQSGLKPRLLSRTSLSGIPLIGVSLAALAGIGLSPTPARALPQDGQVVAGAASISQTGAASLAINQSSMAAIIDWRSFDIAANETVEVFQPSSMASLLNRVIGGGGASEIMGTLRAQGRLTLVNPAGITIGNSARIDVAGLVASTANMSNQDFMAGRGNFTTPGHAGARIANAGDISIREGGMAAFVAPGLENSGTITARLGRVQMAAGDVFTLDMYGDDLIHVGVTGATLASVVNTGRISADGGVIGITAKAGAAAVDGLINMGGVVEARSAGVENGTVVFYGADPGVVKVSGAVDVSGRAAGQSGGTIKVLGEKVALTGAAHLDASGDAGGGVVLVGGDYQGKGATPAASRTYVGRDARITADAITSGNAQKVVVWADGDTRFYGSISAKGGAQGGDGGLVEVSGKQNLGFDGHVDASAPHGTSGSLLLDPDTINIKNGSGGDPLADGQVTDGLVAFPDFVDTGTPGIFNISETALEALTTATLTLQAKDKITLEDLTTDGVLSIGLSGLVKFEAGAGGIIFRDINDEIKLTNPAGSLTLDATKGTGSGVVDIGKITLNGGALTLTGSKVVINPAGVSTSNGPVTITAQDVDFFGPVNAGTNNVFIKNSGSGSIRIGANDTAAAMNISNADLANITAHSLSIESDTHLDFVDVAAGAVSVDTIYLKAASSVTSGGASIFKDLQIDAVQDINLDGDVTITTGAGLFFADTNLDLSGNFNLGSGKTLTYSGGGVLLLQGNKINLAGSGGINAAGKTVQIANRSGVLEIGGGAFLTSADLGAITAGNLLIDNAAGIKVSGVAATDSDGFDYITLKDPGTITFDTAPSTFKSLIAKAGGSIDILADLTVTHTLAPSGADLASLVLFADEDKTGGGNLLVGSGVVVKYTGASGSGAGYFNTRANDLILDGTMISPDSIDITNTAGGSYEIGATPDTTFNLENAELGRLQTPTLRLASGTGLTLDGVSDPYTGRRNIFASAYGGDLLFTGGSNTFAGLIWAQATAGVIKTGAPIKADSIEFISPAVLTGKTDLLSASSVITKSIDGGFDLNIGAGTALTLGRLGGGAPLGNVVLNSAADVPIGSATTPLYVNALTLALFTSAATLDSAGKINGAAIDNTNVKFKGAFNVASPPLNFTAGSVTAAAGTILIIDGGSGADDVAVADGQILFSDFGSTGFVISKAALEALTGSLTLQAPDKITLQDLALNQLLLTKLSGPVKFEAGAGGIIFRDINDEIKLTNPAGSLTLDATKGTGSGVVDIGKITLNGGALTLAGSKVVINPAGASTSNGPVTITAQDVDFFGPVNAGTNNVFIKNSGSGSIRIGANDTAAAMNISNADLANITAGALNISSPGVITVDGVTSDDTGRIGQITLSVHSESALNFSGGASTFANALNADSQGDVHIAAVLTVNDGSAQFNADSNADGAGNFTADSGITVRTLNGDARIIAKDFIIDGAFIEAIGHTVSIEGTSGGATVGVTGGFPLYVSNAELENITASEVQITSAGDMTVNGVTAAATEGKDISLHAHNLLKFQGGVAPEFSQYLFASSGSNEIDLIQDIKASGFYFNDALFILNDRIITSVTGGEFAGPVNNTNAAGSLKVLADAVEGTVTFRNHIGALNPLDGLTVTAGNIHLHDVTTKGDQTYGTATTVYFNSTYTTNGGNFTVNGSVVANSPSFINTGGGTVTITNGVSGASVTVNGSSPPPPPVTSPPPPPVTSPPPPPPPVTSPPPPPPVTSPPPPVTSPPPPVTSPPPPPVTSPPPPLVTSPPPPVTETPPPPLVTSPPPPPVTETPPTDGRGSGSSEAMAEAVALEDAMKMSTDIANQVDALSNKSDGAAPEGKAEEDAKGETGVDFSSVAGVSNAILQIIELEDLGDPFDEDAAPAVTPNCVCSG